MFFSGYLALGAVDGSNNFTESTDSAYVRQPWSFARKGGSVLEGAPPVVFPVSAGSYTVNAFAFFAKAGGGAPVLLYSLPTPVTVSPASYVTFQNSTIVVDNANPTPAPPTTGIVVSGTPPAVLGAAITVDLAHVQSALAGMPTSSTGLPSGSLWNNGGSLAIVP